MMDIELTTLLNVSAASTAGSKTKLREVGTAQHDSADRAEAIVLKRRRQRSVNDFHGHWSSDADTALRGVAAVGVPDGGLTLEDPGIPSLGHGLPTNITSFDDSCRRQHEDSRGAFSGADEIPLIVPGT